MKIDFNVLARGAKLVALLGFFLPWVAVSCSGTEIATGTGWQWMTGDLQPAGPMASMAEASQAEGGATTGSPTDDQDPAYVVIAAFAAIALGLLASFVTRGRVAAGIMLVGAIAGIGLSFYNFEYARAQMTAEAQKQNPPPGPAVSGDGAPIIDDDAQRQMQQAIANAVQIEKKEGFWVSMVALGLAALFAGLSLAGLAFPVVVMSRAPAPPPPPS